MADALLDDMEGRNCDFFFNEASPRSGLVRDRAPTVGTIPQPGRQHRRHRLRLKRLVHRRQI